MTAAPPTPYRNPKYRWRDISRVNPSKRAANDRVHDYCEIVNLLDEKTVREQASRCLHCPHPLCMDGCPLRNRIPEWLALAAEGDFLGAAAISRETSNMPEICSRVCPQEKLCEGSCVLGARGEPVTIGAIEKFINEYAFEHEDLAISRPPRNGHTVAVVGSGPAGLACADELAKLGYAVTVFEADAHPGGLLMNGIPGFKLSKEVVERRIEVLLQRGVAFQNNTRIGKHVGFDQLRRCFDAIFLGIGAQKAKLADVPGEDLPGVHAALPFLIQHNSPPAPGRETIDVRGKRVAVLGGGDTAMDCLRTALRAGAAEAICLYRRDLANMPGSRKEYYNAIEEGARFEFLTNPTAIEPNAAGHVGAVRVVRMQLGAPDAQGRRQPVKVPGSETSIPADIILVAYGFDPEAAPRFNHDLKLATDRWGALAVDKNQMTSIPGIFAGGDSSRGASLVVHAVRDGRIAAAGIHNFLNS